MRVIRSTEQLKGLTETVVPSQPSPVAKTNEDEWLLATHGRTFHFASRFLAPKMRRDVVTLYAFFRTLDDLVDIPVKGRSIEDIRIELESWKSWFSKGRSSPAPREPLGSRLAAVLTEHYVPTTIFLDLLEVMFVQALPLPLMLFLIIMPMRRRWMMMLNCILGALRIGVLLGTMRAYRQRPWSYWLSPLCDLPVAIQLARSALRRRHIWRGRVLVRGAM